MSGQAVLHTATAVILAGGLGTRLRSAVGDRPKPLAPINGRPFLDYQISQLARFGITDILLCVGFEAQTIVETMGGSSHGARLRYVRDWPLRGTGGALRQALAAVSAPTILAVNGDTFSGADLTRFADAHARNRQAEVTMLLSWREDRESFGGVTCADDGKITAFVEKQAGIGPGHVNAGVYLFERTALADISPDRVVSLERETLPSMIGHGLYGWADDAAFVDIGTPESFREAHAFLREENSI